MVTYGTFYFLVPRMMGRELYSSSMAHWHFVLALGGTLLYIMAMWASGVSQGLLALTVDEVGELRFSFRDIMSSMVPYYALRFCAGLTFLAGTCMMVWNLYMTIRGGRLVDAGVPPVPEEWRIPSPADRQSAQEVHA